MRSRLRRWNHTAPRGLRLPSLSRLTGVAARVLGLPLSPRRAAVRAADAAVVLGSPTMEGRLTAVGEERVRAGVKLWRLGLAPVLCFSGGGGEASAMTDRARALGVPGAAIRLEPTARSTRENAREAAAILAAEGRRTVWVVTQPFHLRRALYWFRRAGLEPLPWHIDESVQYRRPERAIRWIGREYAAWVALLLQLAGEDGWGPKGRG